MIDKELIVEIVIPNYIRKVLLSKARMAKYYVRYKKEPTTKKAAAFLANGRYVWEECKVGKRREERLYDIVDKEFVVRNSRTAGKPKEQIINGQSIYSGLNDFVKGKMMREIKASFLPIVHGMKIPPISDDKLPIRVLCELHDTIEGGIGVWQRWDVDNRMYPYNKAFMDVLTKYYEHKETGKLHALLEPNQKEEDFIIHSILPDDDRLSVTQPPTALFCPIDDEKDAKLVYKIYADKRQIVEKIKGWKERSVKKSVI